MIDFFDYFIDESDIESVSPVTKSNKSHLQREFIKH